MPSEAPDPSSFCAPEALRSDSRNRDHVRCGVCGVPWEEHTFACTRHPQRGLDACVGIVPSAAWRCCELAGIAFTDWATAECPFLCGCHKVRPGIPVDNPRGV